MDLQIPLLIITVVAALVTAIRSARTRPPTFGTLGIAVAVLVLAAIGWLQRWAVIGSLVFALWMVLALLPTLLARGVIVASARLMPRTAEALAWVIAVLHPAKAMRLQARRFRVARLEHEERNSEALAAISAIVEGSPVAVRRSYEAWGALSRLRLLERWDELDETSAAIPDALLRNNAALLILVLRVDLELGQRRRAMTRFLRARAESSAAQMAAIQHQAALALLAYAGRIEDVRLLLDTQLASHGGTVRALWLATARAAAGDQEGVAELEALARSSAAPVARSARVRLTFLDRLRAEPYELLHQHLLDELGRAADVDRRYRLGFQPTRRPVVTYGIVGLLVAMFGVELLAGGSTDLRVLIELGALVPSAFVERGQWHTIFTFLFLHYGVLHLAMNAIGLLLLGPFVERSLSRARYVIVYLASGLVGGALIVLRYRYLGDSQDALYVGASGSILGMVGATCALLARAYHRERVKLGRQRLLWLALLVVLQTVSDLLIENVSFFAHAVGAATGLVLTALIRHERQPLPVKRPASAQPEGADAGLPGS